MRDGIVHDLPKYCDHAQFGVDRANNLHSTVSWRNRNLQCKPLTLHIQTGPHDDMPTGLARQCEDRSRGENQVLASRALPGNECVL